MNKINFKDEFLSSGWVKNEHYLKRYLKLINCYIDLSLKKNKTMPGEIEGHHILPVKLWPEYITDKSNIVFLPVRAHFIAHYMLYKFLNRKECVFAFNQMRRFNKLTKSKMYESLRRELGILMKEMNSGRKWKDEQYVSHILFHKGKNTYRNIETNEYKKFKVGEEPVGWIAAQCGRIKNQKSKNQLSAKMKHRKWQYHPETRELRFDTVLHEGFIIGLPDWYDNNSDALKEYKWAYDPIIKKNIRAKLEDIPSNYIIGRDYDNKGLEKLNDPTKELVLDVSDLNFKYVDKHLLPNPNYIKPGRAIDDIFIFEYKDKKFYSWDHMEKCFPELPKVPKRDLSILDYKVPKRHYNQTLIRQNFCEQHYGKTFREIGMKIRKLKE